MVRIPGPETVTRARLTRDPGADVREGAEAIGKGLKSLGKGITDFAKAEKKKEDQLAASRRAAELARLETEGIRRLRRIHDESNPRRLPVGPNGTVTPPPGSLLPGGGDPGISITLPPGPILPGGGDPGISVPREPPDAVLLPAVPFQPGEPIPRIDRLPDLSRQPGDAPPPVNLLPAPFPSGPPNPDDLVPPFNRALMFGERAAAAIDEIVAGVQNLEQREKLRLRLTRFQRSLAVGVARQQQVEEGETARRLIDANSQTFLLEIQRDPSRLAEVSAFALDAIADPDLRLSAEERGERAAFFQKAAVKTALFATIRDDPARAEQALESGRLNSSGGAGGIDQIKLAQFLTKDERRDARTVLDAKKRDVQRKAMEDAAERDKETARRIDATASDLRAKIERAEVGEADIEIALQTGSITTDQREELILAAQRKAEQVELDRARIARVEGVIQNDPRAIRDPADPDYRMSVDMYFRDVVGPGLQGLEPEVQKRTILNFAAQVGVVPDRMFRFLRGALVSLDPTQRVQAADTIARLAVADPNLVNQFSDRERTIAQTISNLIRSGVAPEDAVRLTDIQTTNVPNAERELRRDAIRDKGHSMLNREFVEDALTSTLIGREFRDRSFGLAGTRLPDKLPDRLIAEFNRIAQVRFLETGDLDAAQQLALQDVKKVWAVSVVGGPKRWMKFAPEAMFRTFDGESQDAAWIQEQLEALVLGLGAEGVAAGSFPFDPTEQIGDPKRIRIVADSRTSLERVPSYLVVIESENKTLTTVDSPETGRPIRWTPDFATSPAAGRLMRARDEKVKSERRKADFLRTEALRNRDRVQRTRRLMDFEAR